MQGVPRVEIEKKIRKGGKYLRCSLLGFSRGVLVQNIKCLVCLEEERDEGAVKIEQGVECE